MPRPIRIDIPGFIYHIINRGNNRQPVFQHPDDFKVYLDRLKIFKQKYCFKLYAYCLMDNHIHLIIEPTQNKTLSKIIQSITLSYLRLHHAKYKTCGHLWQGRFKSLLIQTDAYLLECIKYVELNPVKARIVKHPQQYPWSSYGFHAQGKDHFDLLDENPLYKNFGNSLVEQQTNYQKWILEKGKKETTDVLEKALKSDLAIGDEQFLQALKKRLFLPTRKKGRPRKSIIIA